MICQGKTSFAGIAYKERGASYDEGDLKMDALLHYFERKVGHQWLHVRQEVPYLKTGRLYDVLSKSHLDAISLNS